MKKLIAVITAVMVSGCATGYEKVNCTGIYSIKTPGMGNNVIVKFDKRRQNKQGYMYHQVPQLGFRIRGGWIKPEHLEEFSCHGE
ncbi:hypothetical protein ABM005_17030 [Morganella morganii]|uniref:hypothetical protein n=1 Tax=Morganella morganii TaxID=582 RepID=UPI000469173F|nr:hypothetical protein [Morganella morganii]